MVASYAFVIQPSSLPPVSVEDEAVNIQVSSDNSYLRINSDGTYTLIVDNEEWETIQEAELKVMPYSRLHIK